MVPATDGDLNAMGLQTDRRQLIMKQVDLRETNMATSDQLRFERDGTAGVQDTAHQ
jgi:hypothetical protein